MSSVSVKGTRMTMYLYVSVNIHICMCSERNNIYICMTRYAYGIYSVGCAEIFRDVFVDMEILSEEQTFVFHTCSEYWDRTCEMLYCKIWIGSGKDLGI